MERQGIGDIHIMRQTFNPITGRLDIVGVTEGDIPTETEQWFDPPHYGLEPPGTEPNTMDEGHSRIWYDTGNAKVYIVNRADGIYRKAELT